jgi:hypothetical protein
MGNLGLAGELGMVKLGNLATDGTKIEANVSRHKAMSCGYMLKELARLKNEIEQGQPRPIPNTADTGYYSEENVRGVAAVGLDPYLAIGREKHIAPQAGSLAVGEANTAANSPAAGLAEESPKAGHGAEAPHGERPRPVCGAETHRGTRVRPDPAHPRLPEVPGSTLESVSAEWQLTCLTHNPLKIWRHVSSVS